MNAATITVASESVFPYGPAMSDTTKKFAEFDLNESLLRATENLGFEEATPIQTAAIPPLIEGRDVIGRARTGSGKTAAFGLPLLNGITDAPGVQALVLAPTRELAIQVASALEQLRGGMRAKIVTIYGGASYRPQLRGLKAGASIVVGTPGRVIDMMERGALKVGGVRYFVLDEADEMLKMGFIEDIETVMARLPEKRQVALFSATMPRQIKKVAQTYLNSPIEIQVEDSALTVDHIDQTFIRVPRRQKPEALLRLLATQRAEGTLVFCRTKAGCAETAAMLMGKGISADAIHGDLDQRARERVLDGLRSKVLDVVVGTDVAARGLDVQHLTHVINYDLPQNAEIYVHRIGRTGRAGKEGNATTLVEPGEWRRSKQFAKQVGVKFDDVQIPTESDVEDAQRMELRDRLEEKMIEPGRGDAAEWLVKLKKDNDWSIEEIAIAAVRLLEDDIGLDIDGGTIDANPDYGGDINEVEVVLGRGRRDRIRAGDIVGVFTNELGVPSNLIGRITLATTRAFVGLPASVATRILAEHSQIMIRNKPTWVQPNTKQGGDDRPIKAQKKKSGKRKSGKKSGKRSGKRKSGKKSE